jgi:hypothetical protein
VINNQLPQPLTTTTIISPITTNNPTSKISFNYQNPRNAIEGSQVVRYL